MSKKAMLRPMNPPLEGTDATFMLTLSSMRTLTRVKLEIRDAYFKHENDAEGDSPLGTLTGSAAPAGKDGFTLALDENGGVTGDIPQPDKDKKDKRVIAIVIPKGLGSTQYIWKFFAIPDDLARRNWFLYVKMLEPDTTSSNRIAMGVAEHALEVGKQATYDWHADNQIQLFAHGKEKSPSADHPAAFEQMVDAIKKAKNFIFITDWSFQPYFRVVRGGGDKEIGTLLLDQAKNNPDMIVGILAWRHPPAGAVDAHNNDAHERFLALNGNAKLPDNLLWRATQHTATYSHHQKFVVLDAPVDGSDRRILKAFFGGLDLTKGRWDWDEHVIDPQASGADKAAVDDFMKKQLVPIPGKDPIYYDDWYSAEFQNDWQSDRDSPRQPWHDIYACVTGPTAWDIVKEWVGRWNDHTSLSNGDMADIAATGIPTKKTKLVNSLYDRLHDRKKFIQQFDPSPTSEAADTKFRWGAQMLRSMTRDCWETDRLGEAYKHDFTWTLDGDSERSIQDAYLKAIGLAEEYIYIETQYFISSGNDWVTTRWNIHNTLAHAICDRIKTQHGKGKKFHCYVICPMYPEGAPNMWQGVPQMQRHFEWETMQYMIGRVQKECGDWKKYLSFFLPAKNGTPKTADGTLATPEMFVDKDGKRSQKLPGQSYFTASDTKTVKVPRLQRVRHNNRYMVYVHSKLMIVDDTYCILGSANLNERSLAGDRDTEICVHMWPKYPKFLDACKKQLKEFRDHLFTEHFGATGDPKSFGKTAQDTGLQNYKDYALGVPIKKGKCLMLPFKLTWESHMIGDDTPLLRLEPLTGVAEWSNEYVFDADDTDDQWKWWSTKTWLRPTSGAMDLAE